MGNIKWELWPNGQIEFRIDEDARIMRDGILNAVAHWNKCTPINLIENNNPNGEYLRFRCWAGDSNFSSRIGHRCVGDRHTIRLAQNLPRGHVRGVAIHEIGHVVGLYHEHQRQDRNKHILVLDHNLEPVGKRLNVTWKLGTVMGAYDFDSIMHYGSYSMSRNGNITLDPMPHLKMQAEMDGYPIQIGRRGGLSRGDIMAVYFMYASDKYYQYLQETQFSGCTFYDASQFSGTSFFAIRDVPNFDELGVDFNNGVGSILLHEDLPAVTLYKNGDYAGPSVQITDNKVARVGDLQFSDGSRVDQVASAKVHCSGVTMYQHAGFQGKRIFSATDLPRLHDPAIDFNDRASSIRLHGNVTNAILYKHSEFRGPSIQIHGRQAYNFQTLQFDDGSAVNDQVSSIRIN